MGKIQKQTILSSILVYFGFLIGAINLFFYTKSGATTPTFSAEEFGLTRIFFDFSQNIYAFSSLGVIPVIYKFYPYYKDNLEAKKIDLMSWAMLIAFAGFIIALFLSLIFKPFFVEQFSNRSSLIIQYYYWIFPFAFGMLIFAVLEGFCWGIQETVLSNFLKETGLRLLILGAILMHFFRKINFDQFIKIFALLYLMTTCLLLFYLIISKKLYLSFHISKVTTRFKNKMISMQSLVFGGTLIAALASTIDSFLIAKIEGLAMVGIYGLALYIANIIQVPQRTIQSIAAGVISRAWKEKNYSAIQRIYYHSCINLFLIALGIFGNIALNIYPALNLMPIQKTYEQGIIVFFILGFVRIIDAVTGLNNVIINTSAYWKFDFLSLVFLLLLRLPLTYFLIQKQGIIGAAIAELLAYSIFNIIRFEFLRNKLKTQPLDKKIIYALLIFLVCIASCFSIGSSIEGWKGILLRVVLFSTSFFLINIYFKTSNKVDIIYKNFKRNILNSSN